MLDLILATALLQAADPCHAADGPPGGAGCPSWREIWRGDRGVLSADPASLRPGGDSFEIRIRFVYAEAFPSGIRTITSVMRMDCTARIGARRNGVAYATDGTRLQEEDPAAPPTTMPVDADGPEDALLAEYCPRGGTPDA